MSTTNNTDTSIIARASQTLRNRLSAQIGHRLIKPRNDDIYLGAFPRSGSTWLRTIIVNVLDDTANSNPDVFNAKFPAVSIRNARMINTLEPPRRIMTHVSWLPSIKQAVYLVRDGRDAFISSYHYHTTRNQVRMSVMRYYELYRAETYGRTWDYHTLSWLNHGRDALGSKLLNVRFEDLRIDPFSSVEKVCRFMNINVEAPVLEKAINLASLDNARRIERARGGAIKDQNSSFYRQGKSRQWQSPEYDEVIEVFESDSKKALLLAGYELR